MPVTDCFSITVHTIVGLKAVGKKIVHIFTIWLWLFNYAEASTCGIYFGM